MKLYYLTENGYYSATSEAFLDPLETELQGKDVWLMPPNATLVKPPTEKDGYKLKFNGKKWDYEEIPVEKPHAPTFDELKDVKKREIKIAYLTDVAAIVWVEQAGGVEYGYDTDKDSQIDFNSSYQRAQINGTTHYNVYVDRENLSVKAFVEHNAEMFAAALNAAGNSQEGVYAHYYALKQQIDLATSKKELDAINW